MPKSKNRRTKRYMKPRTFKTVKSARRYVNRFRMQFQISGKYNRKLVNTMVEAIRISRLEDV